MSDFPNRPPSPFEILAKQAGRALLKAGAKALARGADEALNSAAEDADKLLEAGEHVLERLKDKIAHARRPR